MRLKIRAVVAADLRPFVPVHPEPAEPLQDQGDGALDVPLLVGVVNPEHELAPVVTREQPVEKRRADPSDVEEAGRAGGESGPDTHGRGTVYEREIGTVGGRSSTRRCPRRTTLAPTTRPCQPGPTSFDQAPEHA